jgi:hypothetical protein
MNYQLIHLLDRHRSTAAGLLEAVQNVSDVRTWGVFPGLFGLGTNEVYWVVMTEQDYVPQLGSDIEVVQQTLLTPTIRPLTHEPRSKAGVYVYRWFEVDARHIDEVVRLSGEAWAVFEGGFDTEIQGLFVAAPEMSVGQVKCGMLLVTWYRDLSVWQDSRTPDAAASKRFAARQALLDSAVPIATRLEKLKEAADV